MTNGREVVFWKGPIIFSSKQVLANPKLYHSFARFSPVYEEGKKNWEEKIAKKEKIS